MKRQTCYASLAVYSKEDIAQKIGDLLNQTPSLVGERNGTYSWVYTTRGAADRNTIELHFDLLKATFNSVTETLIDMFNEGIEIRVWIYFGLEDPNRAFVIPSEFVAWLTLFGADICVDLWQ